MPFTCMGIIFQPKVFYKQSFMDISLLRTFLFTDTDCHDFSHFSTSMKNCKLPLQSYPPIWDIIWVSTSPVSFSPNL